MTILIAKEIMCDGCAEWVRLDTPYVNDEWRFFKADGWSRKGGKHWCPECTIDNQEEEDDEKLKEIHT